MIFLSADHAGFDLKEKIKLYLAEIQLQHFDLAPIYDSNDDYPDRAKEVAEVLKKEPESLAIVFCGTGQGICMALNRHPWIRAGATDNPEIVDLIKKHNNANVLCLAGRFITYEKAVLLVNEFLRTTFDNSQRHIRRINKFN